MAANLTFIVQSAKTHAHIFAFHCLRDALSKRGLTNTRRAIEAEDGRLQITTQLKDGHIFQYALLHLFHSIVVVIKNLLRTLQVEVVVGVFAPRKAHHRLQIVQLHAIFRTLRVEHVQLVQLFGEHLFNLVGPYFLIGLHEQFKAFRASFSVAQLLLDVLDLLLKEVFSLLLINLLTRLRADVLFQLQQLAFLVQHLQCADYAFHQRVGGQHLHLVHDAERHVRANEMQSQHVVLDVVQRILRLVGNLLVQFDVFDGR